MEKTSVIGIDIGTSGCRGVVIDETGRCLAEAAVALPPGLCVGAQVEQPAQQWWDALQQLLPELLDGVARETVRAIALDATSGTVLLSDVTGAPLTPALMYNDNRAVVQAERIADIAPRDCAAHGTGSGLAKALWLLDHHKGSATRIHTQADWLCGMLCGNFMTSDTNNALKLGYDPVRQHWPAWLGNLGITGDLLPHVVEPGTPIANLSREQARSWGLRSDVILCAGTTDSTAAFIASGAREAGEAVTSLGSTLVLKVLSAKPVFAPEYGVYSQPLGKLWLVGGGSNSGGAVLRHYFSDTRMAEMSRHLEPEHATGLDYYPLLAAGERFPICDPRLPPRVEPRPDDDTLLFQGLLEGIARIEKQGYDKLAALGAPYPVSVRSNGGGAKNDAWTHIRQRMLGVPLIEAEQQQACYGAARLARRGLDSRRC